MFTEVEYTYLKNLVDTYITNGIYTSYLAYTYTDISGNYNVETPDFIVIFSKENIVANGNNFNVVGSNVRISVDSTGASRNSTNGARYVFTEDIGNVSVPEYEFIYTNASGSRYADLLASEVAHELATSSSDLSYNLTKNEFYIIPILLALLIMMLFLKWCFPMKGGKKA